MKYPRINNYLVLLVFALLPFSMIKAQDLKIEKLVLNKKEKRTFNKGDSTMTIHIDTLIMRDRSSLQFFGKKDIKLTVGYAEIGNRAFINGVAAQNNATNFDIDINFNKLGSLYIIARGIDAMNGTKTFPNGDGGIVNLTYDSQGIQPQSENRKEKNYLYIDVSAGGRTTNPTSDLSQIYSRIAISPGGLRGLPQGQIYSGSYGKEGKSTIKSK